MLMQGPNSGFKLMGFDNAGTTDVYLSLIDPNGYPLTAFRYGKPISDYNLLIEIPLPLRRRRIRQASAPAWPAPLLTDYSHRRSA